MLTHSRQINTFGTRLDYISVREKMEREVSQCWSSKVFLNNNCGTYIECFGNITRKATFRVSVTHTKASAD